MRTFFSKTKILLYCVGLLLLIFWNAASAADERYRDGFSIPGVFNMELGDPDAGTPRDQIICSGPGFQCMID